MMKNILYKLRFLYLPLSLILIILILLKIDNMNYLTTRGYSIPFWVLLIVFSFITSMDKVMSYKNQEIAEADLLEKKPEYL